MMGKRGEASTGRWGRGRPALGGGEEGDQHWEVGKRATSTGRWGRG